MSLIQNLAREVTEIPASQRAKKEKSKNPDKTNFERQRKDRAKKKEAGLVVLSAYIDAKSKAQLSWILKAKPHLTKGEFIERFIQREFNRISKQLYERIDQAQNAEAYNEKTKEAIFDNELLNELDAINIKKIKKSDTKYKQSIHPTAQPINRSKKSKNEIDDYQGTNEAFDDFTF